MYKDYRYINAGTNEIHRYGHKAQERAAAALIPNEQGFYSIPADGGKFWTIGTSEGKFGEFAKHNDTFLSVNKSGNVWAKVGSNKEQAFLDMVNGMIVTMAETNNARFASNEDEEEE